MTLNWSFKARLYNSTDTMKKRYCTVCDELASYEGLNITESWDKVRISLGKKTYAVMFFRGATLCVAMALNPADYIDTKYVVENIGDVARFASTPVQARLSSERQVRYLKELLDTLFDKVEKGAVVEHPQELPYHTQEELIEMKLIRVSGQASTVSVEEGEEAPAPKKKAPPRKKKAEEPAPVEEPAPAPAETPAEEPAPTVEEPAPAEAPVEEPVVEEAPAEEPVEEAAATVAEEPAAVAEPEVAEEPAPVPAEEPAPTVVEPSPVEEPIAEPEVAEEPTPAEEPVVEEAPAEKPVEAPVVETPAPVVEKPAAPKKEKPVRKVEPVAAQGEIPDETDSTPKGIVNVGTLDALFEANSVVTADTLKQLGILSGAVNHLKVLGGGELSKPLTIAANAFSKSAKAAIAKAGGKTVIVKSK